MTHILRITALALLVLALFAFGCESGQPKGEPVRAEDGVVRIDTAGIRPGETRFFRYVSGTGNPTVFLIARTKTGELKAALDACVTCYPHKKGYRAEEGCVVCVYCDTRFELDELGTGRGNCIPVTLPFALDGPVAAIKETDLIDGSRYFPGLGG